MTVPVVAPGGVVPLPPQSAVREAAQQFEALLLRQMLAASRDTAFGGEELLGEGDQTFREMRDARFAEIASASGTLGLAQTIERQLARMTAKGTS